MIKRLLGFLGMMLLLSGAMPALADEVRIDCWCQQETNLTCNHVARVYSLSYSQDDAFTDAHRTETCNRCTSYCASLSNGPWRATHCDPSDNSEDICPTCNADPASSCTEAQGARLSFSAEQDRQRQQQLQAQCEAQTAHPIFPIQLGTPIGGVTQVNGLAEYINVAYRYLVSVVLVVAIVMTVYGGFRYLFGASIGSVGA
ncbi:MAG TPA: hypothetical protein VMU11_04075, partial [Verrucomicrobiae bacterium]|nr:hypothetical protein [Verrucomicrobiae bacterium]